MKKIIISIAALVVAAAATLSMVSRSDSDSLFVANVDALSSGESDLVTKCGGCSTDKNVYCCTLIIVDVGTFYLYRD
ncbi:MAG: hypothetical protein ACI3ZS_01095 [Candidatus Cryptobacteroides sp.]